MRNIPVIVTMSVEQVGILVETSLKLVEQLRVRNQPGDEALAALFEATAEDLTKCVLTYNQVTQEGSSG